MRAKRKKQPNRFAAFNPEERLILQTLLQDHGNTVASIGCGTGDRLSAYLVKIEELENECKNATAD